MTKTKILFAIGRLTVGGGEKLLVYQLKHLDREKFEPHLLTLFPEREESFSELLKSDFRSSEVRLQNITWKQLNFYGLFDIFSWLQLVKFLKKEKFDVVVTSLFSANLMVRSALLFSGRPIARPNPTADGLGWLGYVGPKVLISYEHNIYRDKHRWQIWADWFLARFTDKIIVDAESVKTFTAKQEGIPAEKFLVIHIPPLAPGKVDAAQAASTGVLRTPGVEEGAEKIILNVSRLVEEKGHIYLIRAAREVIKSFPNARFLIVGWGHLEQSLKDEVKKLGLENNVKLLGKRDIAEFLPLADIYVEPALSVDIGIASMEAMTAGLPMVSTNVGEMSVFIKEGENGFLVPPADSISLADKIIFLLKNDDLRKKMGEKSKERVKDFSMEKYMEKFEELIISLINREF